MKQAKYIKYNEGTEQYEPTKKRPGNQSETHTLYKINERFKKTVDRNQGLSLTALQNLFKNEITKYKSTMEKYLKKFKNYKLKFQQGIKKLGLKKIGTVGFGKLYKYFQKIENQYNNKKLREKISNYIKENVKKTNIELNLKGIKEVFSDLSKNNEKVKKYQGKLKKRFQLKDLGIDIAHGIAISKIIGIFVDLLNTGEEKRKNKAKKIKKFCDDILSTDNDPGRETIKDFIDDVKDGKTNREELLKRADTILEMLNACSKNLTAGYHNVNRAIHDKFDAFVMENEGNEEYVKLVKHANINLKNYNKIENEGGKYGPKTTKDGKRAQSSSIDPDKNKSFYDLVTGKKS